ncbi:hypothetical protein SELMODRAFT_36878, partial [Selaginella moellendorffii]
RFTQHVQALDPPVRLFVNDYHVEDGREVSSSAQRHVQQIESSIAQGEEIFQGHVYIPVGVILCGLLNVSSSNEHVRADDLEAVLHEAFAHPAVEGVVLWGFWQ